MSRQNIEVFSDIEQGSEAWIKIRLGLPTASEFKTIIGVKKDAREKVTRDLYMRKLAGEILTGEPMENYSNGYMERGKDQEAEARDLYCFTRAVEPQRVGFVRNGQTGCSPDSLIGDAGGLEIKTALPHIQIERLLRGELPPEHRAQVQGNIWICERQWWDFASFCPKLPLFVVRVHRDDKYIDELAAAVFAFNAELDAMVKRIRAYEGRSEAA